MSTEKQRLNHARNFWAEADKTAGGSTNPGPKKTTSSKPVSKPTSSLNTKPSSTTTSSSSPKLATTTKTATTSSPKPTTASPAHSRTASTASTKSPSTTPKTSTDKPRTASTTAASDDSKSKGLWNSFTSKVKSFTSSSSREPESSAPQKELEIGAPISVVHSGHVGFGEGGLKLSGTDVPPELRLLIERLDSKLGQMGATELSPKEKDVLLRKILTGPRNTVKPNQVTISPNTPISAPIRQNTPTTTNTGAPPQLPPKPAANPNTDGLKRMAMLLSEKDQQIRNLEQQLKAAKAASSSNSSSDIAAKALEEKRVLLQEKRNLEQQVASLRASRMPAQNRATMAPADWNKMLEDRLKEMQAASARETEQLKARLVAVERERDDISDSKAKIEVELGRLKSSKTPVTSTSSSDLSATLKKVEAELNDLKARFKTLEADRNSLEADKRALQSQVDSLQSKVALNEANAAAVQESKKYQQQLEELSKSHSTSLESLRNEVREKQASITKLQQQVKDAELALQSVTASATADSGELEAFRKAMQSELETARQQLSSQEKLRNDLQQAHDALAQKLATAQTQLATQTTKATTLEDSQSKLTARIKELESNLKVRTSELQQTVDSLKTELASAQQEVSSLKGANVQLKSQYDSLQNNLASASTSNNSAMESQLNQALSEAKQAQARLATALSDKERAVKNVAELESKLREITLELQSKQLLSSQESDSEELAKEIAELEKDLEKERATKNRLEDDNSKLELLVNQLKSKLDASIAQQSIIEESLKGQRSELEILRAQVAEMDSAPASTPLAPPPPAPAPPPPMPQNSPSSRAVAPEMSKNLLDSIRNPEVVLKRTSQMLQLPSDVTDGDDILSALARRIIDRRDRLKGGAIDEDLEEEDW